MTEVTQTRTGKTNGNCFAACLASILELPLTSIPDFSGAGEGWLKQVADFLEPMGLLYVQVDADAAESDPILKIMFGRGETFHTVEGVSPRGGQHACVGRNGVIVFDPHPQDGTGRGLKKIETFGFLVARMNAATFAGLDSMSGQPRYEVIGGR